MDKAYIVANAQQEREVLDKLERLGAKWRSGGMPTERSYLMKDTITIFVGDDNQLTFDDEVNKGDLDDCEIVFDGRKEEQMSEKYVVSQEFMNELEEWTATRALSRAVNCFVDINDIEALPMHIETWWGVNGTDTENNNRLIAIIRWVNGEDVFEVEKPKKWIVRSKDVGNNNRHSYVRLVISSSELTNASVEFDYDWATYLIPVKKLRVGLMLIRKWFKYSWTNDTKIHRV